MKSIKLDITKIILLAGLLVLLLFQLMGWINFSLYVPAEIHFGL